MIPRRRPWSLATRYRIMAFVMLFTTTVIAFSPLLERVLRTDSWSQPVVVGIFVLVVTILAVVASTVAHAVARQATSPLAALRDDVRRAVVAEEAQRRGGPHLGTRSNEPEEIGRLREQVRALHAVMRARVDDEARWVGSAVHDIRAGLVGLAHLLDAEDAQGVAGRRDNGLLSSARVEARRLTGVLTRLTEMTRFSRLEDLDRHQVDLERLLTSVVARCAVPQNASHVKVVVDRPETHIQAVIRGDEVLLERAFANLIDNAVRVARSVVKVSIYPNLVRIEDDGPGLKDDVATLSEPFRSESTAIGGVSVPSGTLGLGLFIARRVLEAHDGRLTVERTSSEGTVLLAYLGAGR